jgi:hypothetical protein
MTGLTVLDFDVGGPGSGRIYWVRADLATFGSKLMECEKTDNRKNQYFKEFNKMKLFKANFFIWNVITYH